MIPFTFRLRETVRFLRRSDCQMVVSDTPLSVIRVSERGASILQSCDGSRTLTQIAAATGSEEEQVFKVCDYFNKRGVLEVSYAPSPNLVRPIITVIIPTRELDGDLDECLHSIAAQDYPRERFDVIVIADGMEQNGRRPSAELDLELLTNPRRQGPSYCRNRGAAGARGEVLAFLDSDCVAGSSWLSDIAACFAWDRVGAVGGYVDGYGSKTALERYEKTFSPLNMGKHVLFGADDRANFYVPTCNFFVRKAVYQEVGGLREDLHVGEDVDFCWRLRKRGYGLLYLPVGAVKHKHRPRLGKMMGRRVDYGTSEALLYRLHPDKKKIFQAPPLAAISLIAFCLAPLLSTTLPCLVAAGCFTLEAAAKTSKMTRLRLGISRAKPLFSLVRTYLSFYYFISFHVVRYYLALLILAGGFFHPFWLIGGAMLLVASSVDYTVKRPALSWPSFLFYYALDHMSYQAGVLIGCVRARTFGSYAPHFTRR
jgi:mycofactocin system glycosyltransferase